MVGKNKTKCEKIFASNLKDVATKWRTMCSIVFHFLDDRVTIHIFKKVTPTKGQGKISFQRSQFTFVVLYLTIC